MNYEAHANVILNPSIVTLNEVKSLGVNSVKDLKKSVLKEILRFTQNDIRCGINPKTMKYGLAFSQKIRIVYCCVYLY